MKGTSADGLFLEFWKLNKRRGEERRGEERRGEACWVV
jgi:hypothetical protein